MATIDQLKEDKTYLTERAAAEASLEEAIDAHNREMKAKGEPYEIQKTRSDHPCTVFSCGKTIKAGSRARAITQNENGEFITYYKHLPACPKEGEEETAEPEETKTEPDQFALFNK